MPDESLGGRSYARVYAVTKRQDLHDFLVRAVERAGGTVLYASGADRAPVYLGVQVGDDERLGVLCYPFRCNHPIKGRAADEHRLQVRYGGEKSWSGDHRLGQDLAAVDVTVVLGVHIDADILIGLDPLLYDPLPMGISIEFKDAHVVQAHQPGRVVRLGAGQPPGPERVGAPGSSEDRGVGGFSAGTADRLHPFRATGDEPGPRPTASILWSHSRR